MRNMNYNNFANMLEETIQPKDRIPYPGYKLPMHANDSVLPWRSSLSEAHVASIYRDRPFLTIDTSVYCKTFDDLAAWVHWIATDRELFEESNVQEIFDIWCVLRQTSGV